MNISKLLILFLLLSSASCTVDEQTAISDILYLRNEGSDLPIYVHGNPDEKVFVLVIHGAGSYGLAFRDGAFTSEFEQKYAVAYFDHRGQSMSQGHSYPENDIVELMTDDIEKIILLLRKKYGSDMKLFLMGHSWGGALGTSVLLRPGIQKLIKGWIEIDGAHNFPLVSSSRKDFMIQIANERIAADGDLERWSEIKQALENLNDPTDSDHSAVLNIAAQVSKLLSDEGTVNSGVSSEKTIQAIYVSNPINWLSNNYFNKPFLLARDMDFSLSNRLQEISIPSLLIWGKYDVSVPTNLADDAFEKLGSEHKELHIFENSIHHPHDTEAVKFGQLVSTFIEQFK